MAEEMNRRESGYCRCGARRYSFVGFAASLAALLAACGGTERSELQPLAVEPNGTSVYVQSIEAKGDLVTLGVLAINGRNEPVKLSETTDPVMLQDEAGSQYFAAKEDVEVPPHTAAVLKIPFAGPLSRNSNNLTVRFNPRYGNRFNRPQLMVQGLPGKQGTLIDFATPINREGPLELSAHHANGLTLALGGVRFTERDTRVAFEAINGNDREISLSRRSDLPYLEDGRANRYYLVPPASNPQLLVSGKQKLAGVLHFAGRVPQDVGPLTLHINERFGNPDWKEARDPKLQIAGIAPAQTSEVAIPAEGSKPAPVAFSAPKLPEIQPVSLQVNHPNGTVLRVSSVTFAPDAVVLDMAVTNGLKEPIQLSGAGDMLLTDDLGNPYLPTPPPDNQALNVAPGATLKGRFTFLGRVAPGASRLTLTTNSVYGSDDWSRSTKPKMIVGGISIGQSQAVASTPLAAGAAQSGASAVPGPDSAAAPSTPAESMPQAAAPAGPTPPQPPAGGNTIEVNLQTNHPNGSVMRLSKVTYNEDNIALEMTVTNGHNEQIQLNFRDDMLVKDDLGNRYNPAPPPSNPKVTVNPGATIKGQFVFIGRIAPGARNITLTTNSVLGSDWKRSDRPKMIISGIPVGGS
ncbi:hypothetical protein [Gloeobacter violaceus]|nr:hypothetical protein [Gloeobacter violaceus]